MIKSLLVTLCLMTSGLISVAQDEQRVAAATEITWFGLDLTQVNVVAEVKPGKEVVDVYFVGWNNIIANERDKYDFAKAFKKDQVHYEIGMVGELNQQRDPSTVITQQRHEISEDELAKHIQTYTTSGSGVGLVFVVENFDKPNEEGTIWVTFFDIESKRILLARKMSAKAGGFGFRNYWARTVYNVLKDASRQYRKWVKP